MLIDTHCHLDDYENIDKVINNMKNHIIIVSGVSTATNINAIKLAYKYTNIYATIGIHPEFADDYTDEDIAFIEKNITNKKVVGIGEVGLDYHYTTNNKEKQKELFIKLIKIAKINNKTIVIHSRDAIEDTYNIIKQFHEQKTKFVMHCYSSSLEIAKKLVKMNVKLGIGGVITFKNAKKLTEVVENIDIEHLILETDSPYLAPEPFRGTINEPKNVYYVAKKISELKNMSVDDVIKITTANAIAQFDLDIII